MQSTGLDLECQLAIQDVYFRETVVRSERRGLNILCGWEMAVRMSQVVV